MRQVRPPAMRLHSRSLRRCRPLLLLAPACALWLRAPFSAKCEQELSGSCFSVPRRSLAGLGFLGWGSSSAKAADAVIPPADSIGAALRPGGPELGKKTSCWDVLDETATQGKTAIVTGANTGIGYYTALALAYGGANVVLACRDKQKAEDARSSMAAALKAAGRESAAAKLETAAVDLSSLQSVARFGAEWKAMGKPVHMLCLNAGVMAIPEYRTSADGLEMTMATNHLGHFAMVKALEGSLEAAAPARVVTLASEAHRNPASPLAELPPSKETYNDWGSYQQSKLANILFSNELAEHFKTKGVAVTANAVHPGVITTELGRQQFLKGRALLTVFQDRSAEQGAATSVYCLTAPAVQGVSGKYFRDCGEADPAPYALDASDAKRLWAWSEKVVQEAAVTTA
eukprot:TRINITY_DN80756_c0_g1_i1.p1 TRINITY_DN80756_c0_g1~~TRINITY_DN80756_c0_g1_i1.p1  ORF type:complete len:402 (+),score=72.02 TRINITY_DN80756_c0_g1_i1:37-1242(+)